MKSAFVRSLVILVVSVGAFVRTHGQNGAAPQAAGTYACGACFALDDAGTPVFVPLESTEVVLDVKPGLLEAEVIQTFTNDGDSALEAIYRYPLPPGATLTHFEVRFPDRVLISVVREKYAARAEYVAARNEGRRTALLEKQDPTVFSTSVANFLPGQTVHAVLRFIQPLEIRDDAIEIRFPMVTGMKYLPAGSAPSADSNLPTHSGDAIVGAGHVYAFDIEVTGLPIGTVSSDSHRVRCQRDADGGCRVALEDEITIPDRDFVLRIVPQLGADPVPTWVTQSTQTGNYGMLTVFPPSAAQSSDRAGPRDILFLVDQSGSMSGQRLENAKLGLAECLSRLRPQDRFQVVRFSTGYTFYSERWMPATHAEIAAARTWVLALGIDGGTELQKALRACLDAFERVDREQILIVLTDGDVGEEKALVTMVERRRRKVRVFPIGIGDAPNPFLITKLAACGQGQARFVADDRQIRRELTGMFTALDAPVMSDVSIQFLDGNGVEVPYQAFPETIPDVFPRAPVQTIVRIPEGTHHRLVLRGRVGQRDVTHMIGLAPRPLKGDGLEKLFGARVIGDLEDLLRRAETPEETDLIRAELLESALQFQLVTELTSRVAVDRAKLDEPAVRLVTVTVPQAPVGDQSATIDPNNPDVIVLSPFEVSAAEDTGYTSTSSLAGSRLRTNLRDVGACVQVVNRQFLEDIAASSMEEALPYMMDLVSQPAAQGGQDSGLLDGLPIASVVAPVTVERISDKSFGLAWSGVQQRSAAFSPRRVVAGRVDTAGFASGSIEVSGAFGSDRSAAATALVSWDRARDDRWGAMLAGRKTWDRHQVRARAQARELAGYGRIRGASVNLGTELADGTAVELTLVAHRLDRDDPRQFRLASQSSEYDGLGFLNLDLLTAEVRSIDDVALQMLVAGRFQTVGVDHAWSAGGMWHRRDAAWEAETAAAGAAARRDQRRLEASDRMELIDGVLDLSLTFGATEYLMPEQTRARRSALRGSSELSLHLTREFALFGVVAQDEVLAAGPTGRYAVHGASLVPVTGGLEQHRGGQIGLRVDVLENRVIGHTAWFSEAVRGQSFREWAWERDHAASGPLWSDDGRMVRDPVSLATWRDYVRQGWIGAVDLNLLRELTATASWCVERSNDGPHRGGNRRASLLARYTFAAGALRGLELGLGVAYRNTMTFDDSYELRGGVRWDAMIGYTYDRHAPGATRVQINVIDLTDNRLRPTRFSVDRGRRIALSASRDL